MTDCLVPQDDFKKTIVSNFYPHGAFGMPTLGARAIIIDKDNKILLIKHTYVQDWYLPGGGWFEYSQLPDMVSPGTKWRLMEYFEGKPKSDVW